MAEILRIKDIACKYQAENGEISAIKNISLAVEPGEFISIVGPSGCGKSTLLSIIAGLTPPSGGKIFIDGIDTTGTRSKDIAYMLQRDNLLEWRNIFKNAVLGLEIQNAVTPENLAYVDELFKTYGLWEFKDKFPSQLSGGMRQRVALIRTLAIRPKMLLLDEAFSALDYQTRLLVTDDVYQILKNEKMTAIMVTHDIPESISMSDRVVVLSPRPAVVKNIHETHFDMENRTPLKGREHPKFGEYFNVIWRELNAED